MKVLKYAESNSLDLKLIPRIDNNNLVLYTQKLSTSRTIKNLTYKSISEEYEGIYNEELNTTSEYWSDYKYDNIKYLFEYNSDLFIKTIDESTNIFDRILNLNPKQVGIVNTAIPKLFCEGNEIHYSLLAYGVVPLIYGDRTGTDRYLNSSYSRNVKVNEGIMGWGEIKINNPVFASIFDSFYNSNKSYINAYDTPFSYALNRRLPEDEIKQLTYLEFKSDTLGECGPFYIYTSGSKIGNGFSFIDDLIYTNYSIRLNKNIDFSENGSLKGTINKTSGLSQLDNKLKEMYFWKSGLITTFSEENEVNYYILVGLKPTRYMLSSKIDRMFFIDIGNTLSNTKFDTTDIILYHSDLKTFLKKSNAKIVYFTNLSYHPNGNICPNGLALGADSELIKSVTNSINSGSVDYSSAEYEINNIYNIFISLEE